MELPRISIGSVAVLLLTLDTNKTAAFRILAASVTVLEVTIKRDGLSVKTETRVKKRSVGIPEGLSHSKSSEWRCEPNHGLIA